MAELIDLTGETFGRLRVVRRASNADAGTARWLCVCDCGKEKVVPGKHLRNGRIKSCGCLRSELLAARSRSTKTRGNFRHGYANTRLYAIWGNMKTRCFNSNNPQYKYYGAVGITMCNEWLDFDAFRDWALANGYHDSLTIDRINGTGDYTPENCRWATMKQQNRNKKSNHLISYMGETLPMSEWSERIGIGYGTLQARINRRGWSVEKALSTPIERGNSKNACVD